MIFFTSPREKRLWCYALAVVVAIASTLFLGRPLAKLFANQDIQAIAFLMGMLLVGASIILHGWTLRPSRSEWVIWLGIMAVYLLVFLRLGLAERSHLIEYSVLAIFIHKALLERVQNGKKIPMPALFAFGITVFIGAIDEGIQYFLPSRVFDVEDIIFNSLAAFMAIGGSTLLMWIRHRVNRNQ